MVSKFFSFFDKRGPHNYLDYEEWSDKLCSRCGCWYANCKDKDHCSGNNAYKKLDERGRHFFVPSKIQDSNEGRIICLQCKNAQGDCKNLTACSGNKGKLFENVINTGTVVVEVCEDAWEIYNEFSH